MERARGEDEVSGPSTKSWISLDPHYISAEEEQRIIDRENEMTEEPKALDVVACLTELVRLKDWRDELGRIEHEPGHDEVEMRRDLLRYGIEKKLAWGRAKEALAARGDLDAATRYILKKLDGVRVGLPNHDDVLQLKRDEYDLLRPFIAATEVNWYRDVIAEEMGVDCPPGEAVCPLRDWLRELKHAKAVKKVPTHFAIARGNHYFAHLDISLGPTACVWKGIADVHPFPTEREAREIMKICPPDAVLVPCRVELLPEPPAPLAANDSEGGRLD